jgi:hypothetical protein
MNNFNHVDTSDKNECSSFQDYCVEADCPSFQDYCVEPDYDPYIEVFKGIIYSAVTCGFFWIGAFFLIRWIF